MKKTDIQRLAKVAGKYEYYKKKCRKYKNLLKKKKAELK
jgi:hypothetical protein